MPKQHLKPGIFIRIGLSIVFGLFSYTYAFSQNDRVMAQQMVEIADEIMRQSAAISDARELYVTAANMDEENLRANYMAGSTMLVSVNKAYAVNYLENVLEIDPNYRFDLLFKIGEAYHFGYKFDEAMGYYDRYIEKFDQNPNYTGDDVVPRETALRKIYECEQGKILIEFPEDVEIENLGEQINSTYDDYAPVVDAEEGVLIFTSRRFEGNMNDVLDDDNYPYEDIFISRSVDSVWQKPENIGDHINTLYHDSNVGLSKDGSQLFIYKDSNQGDIYESDLDENNEWTIPRVVGNHINTGYSETSVSLSPDGNVMFFASDRPGGHGGFDIWTTHKDRKGNWEEPVNMGDEINTPLDEDAPFIGFDGVTMYFSSDGGEGMGGFDIYRVTYDSTSSQWSVPSNMGYPINTPDDDIYFVPTKDGSRAYYASVRDDSYGYTDLYVLKIPDLLKHEDPDAVPEKPVPTTEILSPVILQLTVMDENGRNTNAEVMVRPVNSMEEVPALFGGPGVYSFATVKTRPANYYLGIRKEGYQSQSIIVQYPASSKESVILRKIVRLKKSEEEKPSTRRLRNIYFDFGKHAIKAEYQPMIQNAVDFLKANSSAKLHLVGHTDVIGGENMNFNLSLRRAETIKQALIDKGVLPDRITTKGEGSKFPIATNDQEIDGRELNRRVEFKIR